VYYLYVDRSHPSWRLVRARALAAKRESIDAEIEFWHKTRNYILSKKRTRDDDNHAELLGIAADERVAWKVHSAWSLPDCARCDVVQLQCYQ
jgi:hypothetical protein